MHKYKALPSKSFINVNPQVIHYQLCNEKRKRQQWFFGDIVGGDWDLDVRQRYGEQDVGYKNMYQRFIENMPWEETDRFKYSYPKKLKKKGKVRGCETIKELIDDYYQNVDALYYDIKQNGIRYAASNGEKFEPIHIFIGRDGQLIYSGGGNHRLHIAKILGLESIPVFVMVRHSQWQKYREFVFKKVRKGESIEDVDATHPDLQDILNNEAN